MISIPISIEKCIIMYWLITIFKISDLLYDLMCCQFACSCFQWACHVETLHIPSSKYHIRFPFPKLFQRIHPVLRSCVTFHKKLGFCSVELFSPLPILKLEGNLLFDLCNWLYNIHSYTLYLEVILSTCNPRTCHAMPCHGDRACITWPA